MATFKDDQKHARDEAASNGRRLVFGRVALAVMIRATGRNDERRRAARELADRPPSRSAERDGGALTLQAPRGAGKSTTAAALALLAARALDAAGRA